MKIVYIILVVAALLVAAYFCLGCGDSCSNESCKKPNKQVHKEDGACGSCGKNTCDKNCSSSPVGDTTNLKAKIPSCNLSEPQLRARKEELQKGIFSKVKSTKELETGYQFTFTEGKEFSNDLLEFINFERNCCSNFSYALIFEPNEKATHLQVYGSKEIKKELAEGFKELGVLK